MNPKCPFLNNNKWCDHKQHQHKKRIQCSYKQCKNCRYYNESKTQAKDDSESLKTAQEHN